jgi:hypothetical protein
VTLRLWLLLAIGTGGVAGAQVGELPVAQPVFTAESIVPSNGIKPEPLLPGMFVTIYGQALGPASACVGEADRTRPVTPDRVLPNPGPETFLYPSSLCGVEVLVGADAAGLLYVSEHQINLQVPQSIPSEGSAELRVVHRGRSSVPLAVPLGTRSPVIMLDAPAYTNMPVWIHVDMPYTLGEIDYPLGIHPAATYCHEIEVRRNGALLERLPNAEKTATNPGVYSGGPCGVLGLPAERKHRGRLPLHLLYHFEQPGTYEVRLTRVDNLFSPTKTLAVSQWTPIEIRAAPPGRRTEWLAELSRQPPSDTGTLLEDFLPSVLGVPDEESLALSVPYLYHPDLLVRRFTVLGLGYWPVAEQKAVALRLLRERGPTDVLSGLLVEQTDAAVREAVRYLHSTSPVLLTGAIELIRNPAHKPNAACTLSGDTTDTGPSS